MRYGSVASLQIQIGRREGVIGRDLMLLNVVIGEKNHQFEKKKTGRVIQHTSPIKVKIKMHLLTSILVVAFCLTTCRTPREKASHGKFSFSYMQ